MIPNWRVLMYKVILAIFISFLIGAAWVEKQITPYGKLKLFYKNLTIQSVASLATDKTKIDTTHLPLFVQEIDLSTTGIARGKGGICANNNKVFGSSWKGEFFIYDNKGAKRLNLELPINKILKTALKSDFLRVHDIECRANENTNSTTVFMSFDHVENGMRDVTVSKFNIQEDRRLKMRQWSYLLVL
jgi:hypothetical protein